MLVVGMAGAHNSQYNQNETNPIWQVLDEDHHGFTVVDATPDEFEINYYRDPLWELSADGFKITKEARTAPADVSKWSKVCKEAWDIKNGTVALEDDFLDVFFVWASRREYHGITMMLTNNNNYD